MNDGYVADRRLRYHGFAFFDDVLEHKEVLRDLRAYSNWIMPWAGEHSIRGRYPVSLLDPGKKDEAAIRAFLRKEGERIAFLDSIGFKVMWNLPLYELMRTNRFDDFRAQLRVIKECLPEMDLVEYVYMFDEPDLHQLPSTQALEEFIDIFNAEFPGIKTTICYAIVQPKHINVVPPKNLDLLGIDPYLQGESRSAIDFERAYRLRFALTLSWVNRWNKPFFLAGDALHGAGNEGKCMPPAEASLWYYLIAMTQPACMVLAWCYYGSQIIKSENLAGLNPGAFPDVEKVHSEIGAAILGDPSPLGLPGDIGPPPEEML